MKLDASTSSVGVGLKVLRFAGKALRAKQAMQIIVEPEPEPEPEPEHEPESAGAQAEDSPSLMGSMAALRFAGKAKRKIEAKAEERRKQGQNAREMVSVDKQKEIVESQLQDLEQQTDLHAIMSTFAAARFLSQKHQETGIAFAAKQVEERMRQEKPELARKMDLRSASGVRSQIRRLWDLLIAESSASTGNPGVSAFAYYEIHTCISKAVSDEVDDWSLDEAVEVAKTDWVDDVERFSNDSTINTWFVKVKQAITQRSEDLVQLKGWQRLFNKIDLDGSGSLDCDEFTQALRASGIHRGVCDDFVLRSAFESADSDGSGELDAEEFVRWLSTLEKKAQQQAEGGRALPRSMLALLECVAAIRAASAEQVEAYGWSDLFASFDADHSGSLECTEFVLALRSQCGMRHDEIDDADLREVFSIIDTDRSGSISATEFSKALRKNETEGYTMTFEAFEGSMFELADYWSHGSLQEDYVAFFKALFRTIAVPEPGVDGYDEPVLTGMIGSSCSEGAPPGSRGGSRGGSQGGLNESDRTGGGGGGGGGGDDGEAGGSKRLYNYRLKGAETVTACVDNGRFDLGDLTPPHERERAATRIQAAARGEIVRRMKMNKKGPWSKRAAKKMAAARKKAKALANLQDSSSTPPDASSLPQLSGWEGSEAGSERVAETPPKTAQESTDGQSHGKAVPVAVATTPAVTPVQPESSAAARGDDWQLRSTQRNKWFTQMAPSPPRGRKQEQTVRCRRYGPPVHLARLGTQPQLQQTGTSFNTTMGGGGGSSSSSPRGHVRPHPHSTYYSYSSSSSSRRGDPLPLPALAGQLRRGPPLQQSLRVMTARAATAPWPGGHAGAGGRSSTARQPRARGHVYNIQGFDLSCKHAGGKVYNKTRYTTRGRPNTSGQNGHRVLGFAYAPLR